MSIIVTSYILLLSLPIGQIFCNVIHPMVPTKNSKILSSVVIDNSTDLVFVHRVEWGASRVSELGCKLDIIPAPYIIIYHTGTGECYTRDSCDEIVRNLQKKYSAGERNQDIGYNFIISGDGKVYIGRGWDIAGAHTLNFNRISIAIALIGTFDYQLPNPNQYFSLTTLIEFGLKHHHVAKNFILYVEPYAFRTMSFLIDNSIVHAS